MVHAAYDHIVAIVIVGALFVGTVVAVPAISFLNFQAVDQQQLRNTALNVFDAILLGKGSPSDWGSDYPFSEYNVKAFGLASSKESSLYVLDPDKVQRLDVESPGYIEYAYARNLLGLQKYGFSFTLFRPFFTDWDLQIGKNYVWFAINVTRSEDLAPIPNAQVDYTIFAAASHLTHTGEPILVINTPKTFFTNPLGHCEANEPIAIPTDYSLTSALAILTVTVGGMSTMVVARAQEEPLQDFVRIYTFGDKIVLKVRDEFEKQGGGERRIYHIDTYGYNKQIMELFEGSGGNPTDLHITPGEGYLTWEMTFQGLKASNPLLLLFTLRVKNPDRLVIVAGPFSLMNPSKVLTFGPDLEQTRNVAITLRRFVVISDITYIAELNLWEETA